jgi:hypothetical protein
VVDSSHIAKHTFIPSNRCKGEGLKHKEWFVIVASWFPIVAKSMPVGTYFDIFAQNSPPRVKTIASVL